jgi:hypothetical protein
LAIGTTKCETGSCGYYSQEPFGRRRPTVQPSGDFFASHSPPAKNKNILLSAFRRIHPPLPAFTRTLARELNGINRKRRGNGFIRKPAAECARLAAVFPLHRASLDRYAKLQYAVKRRKIRLFCDGFLHLQQLPVFWL